MPVRQKLPGTNEDVYLYRKGIAFALNEYVDSANRLRNVPSSERVDPVRVENDLNLPRGYLSGLKRTYPASIWNTNVTRLNLPHEFRIAQVQKHFSKWGNETVFLLEKAVKNLTVGYNGVIYGPNEPLLTMVQKTQDGRDPDAVYGVSYDRLRVLNDSHIAGIAWFYKEMLECFPDAVFGGPSWSPLAIGSERVLGYSVVKRFWQHVEQMLPDVRDRVWGIGLHLYGGFGVGGPGHTYPTELINAFYAMDTPDWLKSRAMWVSEHGIGEIALPYMDCDRWMREVHYHPKVAGHALFSRRGDASSPYKWRIENGIPVIDGLSKIGWALRRLPWE